MDIKEFSQSHKVTVGLLILALFVVICGAFAVGESVGFHKASFAFQNGDNFYKTYGPPRGPEAPDHLSDDHGTVGKVISVTLPTITVEDRDNTEKTVVVNNQTIVRQLSNTLTPANISVGDYIVALGQPNSQSQIVANLIRILPTK